MRSYLINRNICAYYWLRRRIGKELALQVASAVERVLLVFGREMPTHL
jgi:hypothetical protein